jgi:hypothetical protein
MEKLLLILNCFCFGLIVGDNLRFFTYLLHEETVSTEKPLLDSNFGQNFLREIL